MQKMKTIIPSYFWTFEMNLYKNWLMVTTLPLCWILGLLLNAHKSRVQGQIVNYEPLTCFECTGELTPLCEGDDAQQYGKRVYCPPENNKGGKVDLDDRSVIPNDPDDVLISSFNLSAMYNDPNSALHEDSYGFEKDAGMNLTAIALRRDEQGNYIRVMDGYRCFIMLIQYESTRLKEVYKGCRKYANEFNRHYIASNFPYRKPDGHCHTFRNGELTGGQIEYVYTTDFRICLCSHPDCNNSTIKGVGMDDVEQRASRKKRKSKNGSLRNEGCATEIIALYIMILVGTFIS